MVCFQPVNAENSIEFNDKTFTEFKQKLREEQQHGQAHVFEFQGHKFVVGYAEYLVQYIENVIIPMQNN